jgi:hypothetical protein
MIHIAIARLYALPMSQPDHIAPAQPYPHTQNNHAQPPQHPVPSFWNTPASLLTANQMRRVIRHGVAEGILLASLIGALLSLFLWLVLGAAFMSLFR